MALDGGDDRRRWRRHRTGRRVEERNTTLACVMTDASLDKAACARVARMASGGVARAIDPAFSDVDGDVAFCLGAGRGGTDRFTTIAIGTMAATVTAAAVRDAVRQDLSGVRLSGPVIFRAHARQLQDRGGGPAEHPLRRGGPRASPLQRDAGADRRDRQGVAAAAIAIRRPAGAFLPAGSRPPRGRGGAGDGHLRTYRGGALAPSLEWACPDGGGSRVRRRASAVGLRRSQPPRLQPALSLPGATRRRGVCRR